jgi:hypothetical protein
MLCTFIKAVVSGGPAHLCHCVPLFVVAHHFLSAPLNVYSLPHCLLRTKESRPACALPTSTPSNRLSSLTYRSKCLVPQSPSPPPSGNPTRAGSSTLTAVFGTPRSRRLTSGNALWPVSLLASSAAIVSYMAVTCSQMTLLRRPRCVALSSPFAPHRGVDRPSTAICHYPVLCVILPTFFLPGSAETLF